MHVIASILLAATAATAASPAGKLGERRALQAQPAVTMRRTLDEKGDDDDGGSGVDCSAPFTGKYVQPEEVFTSGSAPPSVVGVGSCWKPGSSSRTAINTLVGSAKPDIMLWLGDQIYGDSEDINVIRRKYDEKKQECDFRPFMESQIPVMATWDDHDFGDDNAVKSYPIKTQTQTELLRHFDVPASDPRYNGREGVYSSYVAGNAQNGRVHHILLDNRYHHSPTHSNTGPCEGDASTMLGDAQWQWLEEQLENVESEVTIIGTGLQVLPPTWRSGPNGNQGYSSYTPRQYCAWEGDGTNFKRAIAELEEDDFFGGQRYQEMWGEFPLERLRLLRAIQKAVTSGKTKTVVLASGDVHFAEILRKEIPATDGMAAVTVHEITASGFSQRNPLANFASHPNRVKLLTSASSNFGTIEIDWASSEVTLNLYGPSSIEHSVTFSAASTFDVEPAPSPQKLAGASAGTSQSRVGVIAGAAAGGALLVAGVAVAVRRQQRRASTAQASTKAQPVIPSPEL